MDQIVMRLLCYVLLCGLVGPGYISERYCPCVVLLVFDSALDQLVQNLLVFAWTIAIAVCSDPLPVMTTFTALPLILLFALVFRPSPVSTLNFFCFNKPHMESSLHLMCFAGVFVLFCFLMNDLISECNTSANFQQAGIYVSTV